jgi:hypothetical protein
MESRYDYGAVPLTRLEKGSAGSPIRPVSYGVPGS